MNIPYFVEIGEIGKVCVWLRRNLGCPEVYKCFGRHFKSFQALISGEIFFTRYYLFSFV